MSRTTRSLAVADIAEAFRARLGFGSWWHAREYGWAAGNPSGYLHVYESREELEELERLGIRSVKLFVTYPTAVHAELTLSEGNVTVIVHPNRVYATVSMKPFGGYAFASLSSREIDEMRRECEPFRLAMEAVEDADAQLKAEAESQEEEE